MPDAPVPPGTPELSAQGLHVFPGLIDAHVHFGFGEKITEYTHETVYAAQGGIATILPVHLSEGYHKRGLPLARICQVLASGPARIFDLEPVKGRIDVGSDADFTLVDLNRERKMVPAELGSYADYSLYENQVLKGWPVKTIVRGVTVMDEGRIVGPGGHGKYLWRRIGQAPLQDRH